MNKIFKVVWNRTIGSFVVTSELAKGRVKSSSEGAEGDVRTSEEGRLKTLFRLTALSAALLGFSEGAWAAMNAKPATGGAVFAIGDGSTSANGTGALAIGNNAQAKTNGALAIGPNSTHTTIANGNNAIAIGVNLQATGQKAIGIGTDTTANGSGAIAIGNNDANRMANQGVNGNGAIGVGSNLTANGNNAIAVGTEAQATAISAVAVGANTQATGAEAVAIGKGAASTASKALAFGQGARAQAGNTVAFGTGAQATQDGSIAIGTNTIATGVYGEKSRKGKAIAIGYNTNALGESSIAIGTDDSFYGALTASSRQGIAIGTGAKATGATQSIALGPDAISSGTQSTSIGNNTRATGDSSIAIGGDDWNIVREKTVAAAGNKQVHQVFQDLTGMPMKQQGEAYGNPFKGTTAGDAAVAIGVAALAEGALSTAFGSGTSASGVGAAAFGVGATASQNKSVAIGAGSHTRTDATAVTEATVNGVTYRGFAGTEHITTGSQVSFGSAGYERQLKHVAPGAITPTSTDAINGSQLYALHVGAGNIAKSVANALGGGAAVGNDPTNNQGSFVTLPSYDVLKGSDTPNTAGNGTAKFNTTPAKNVAAALTNLNTYVNQGFAVKDNLGAAKGIVTPGESVQFADGNATTVTVDTEADGNTKIKYDVKVDDKTIKVVDGKLTGTSQTHFYSVKNEDQTKGNYNNDGATGDNALAAGVDASATANGTTAVGLKAQASAESAIAVGSETKAAAKNAVVIGNKASVEAATGSVASVNGTTTGEGSVAVGAASKASGTNATAVGQAANAYGQNSFAGGQNSKASGKSSVAIGDGANATDDSSSAVGPYAQATRSGASAFGYYANAFGQNSLAAGRNAQATNDNAVALGNESKATGQNTIAFGNNANASQNQAMALGRNTVASAGYTVALGDEAKATAIKAIAFGSGAQATGTNSVATGVQAKAHADDALAVGSNANASGESAIALGKQSNAWKVNSLAFGNSANSNGERAIAIGLESVSNGQNAVSVGQKAYAHEHGVAIGSESNAAQAAAIAIGNKAQAMKYSSIVIGEEAKSNNSRSVVIGYHASATNPAMSASNQDTNQTVAIGAYANAWGDQSTAIGNNVYAKGNSSIAIGSDDWDTVAAKVVDGMSGKTVKEVYQDYTGDEMRTGKDSYTLTTSGEAAVAIGTKSQATGELSTAFGTGTRAEGVASAAFGMGAKATKGNSVAIGAGSTTTTDATEVNEATVNNLKYSGFAGGNNVNPGDQVSFGTAGYERQLKNVAPGEISSTSTDAINGSQLYAVQNVLGNTAKTVKGVLGGNAAVGEDGSFTMSNIGGTGKNTIDEAIRDLNANAYKPFKLTTAKTANTNGMVQDDSLQNITSGSTITLEAGKNISLRQNGATVSINTVDNPEFAGKVTAKGGLDMGGNKITNVAKGDTAGDAVNLGQLQDAMANLRVSTLTTVNNDAPFSYVGTDGRILRREVTVAPGTGVKTVSFKHMDDSTPYTGDVTIAALNPTDPQTTTPTTVGNVKDGAKANDAVNVSQLNKIAEAIGTQVNPDGTITAPTYNVISGNPSSSSVAGYNKVGDALTALSKAVRTPLYFEGDSGEKIDRLLGSTVAVKGGQNNADKLSENNIGVVADKNSGTLNVKLAKELTGLTSAAFSDGVTTGGTTVNGSGVTIGSGSNPVSLTAGGLSNGGNKVTNIADGVADNDAASYKQVKAAKTEVQGGTNVASVTKTDNPTDGHTVYTVNAKGAAVALDSSVDGLKLTSSENTTTNVTTYNLDLSDKTKASLTKADSALQNIGVQVNGEDAKTLNQADSKLNFVNGTGTTAENKNGTVAFNVNKSTLTAGTGGTVNAGKTGDAFATAADVAQAINEAVANSEKTSAVEKGDNTHVAVVEAGNKTTYTVHADKTTVSVKADGKLALKSSETTSSNQTKTTNYELDLTDAAKAEIQKGVEAKNIVDTKGITFNGNSGSPVTKKLDETLAIKGDNKNVVTEAGTDGIKVKLKDDITLTSVTADTLKAGDSVLTNDGLNIANGTASAPVSLTKSGLNNGGNKITKVAKGENEDDAVNYAQLKELADKGLTFDADGSTSTSSKKLGERVGIKGGSNITTSADNDNVTVKLNDDITLNSVTATTLKAGDSTLTNAGLVTPKVTAGNSVLEDNGLTISNGAVNAPVSLTKNGLDNGNNKIAKVAKGTADTDAVNVEQIKPLAAALNTTVGADGTVGQPSFTVKQADGTAGTPVHTVQDALNKVSDELNKGLTIAADKGNADKVNLGETVTYTSKDKNIVTTVGSNEIDFSLANTITVGKNAAGGNPVTIDGTNGTVSGLTNKTLGDTDFATKGQAATEEQIDAAQTNLANVLGTGSTNQNGTVTVTNIGETGKTTVSDAIKSVKETAEKGWNLQANGDTAEKVAAGETVTFKDGKNIKVTRDGKNITVATSDDVEFNAVNATNVIAETVIAGNSVLTTEGLKIGADNSPSQVSLTTAGLSNGGNKIAKVAKGTEDTDGVNVSQIKPLATALNTTVDTDGSIAAPNFTVKQADGTAGTPVHTVQEALDKVSDELTKGLNIVADNGSSEKVNLGDTVTYTSKDKNIVTTSGTGKAIDFSLAEKVTIGKDAANGGKPVVIDGKEGIVSGLTNTTLGSAPLAGSDKAATEAQLDATQVNLATILGGNAANNNGNVTTSDIGGTGENNIHDAIKSVKATADKGWNLKANEETESEKIAAGDTVTVKQGKNIRVKRSGKELTIETSDDVEFGTVSATTVLADSFISGNSVLSGEGLKIGADGSPSQVSLTNAGLNNGGNKIANVAKGVKATDAVNVAQLNEQLAATEKTTTVVAGKNVTVSEKVDGNNTEYTVNADKTTLSQAANGAVKVSEGAKDADGVTDYALDLTDEAKADIAKGVAAKDAVDNKGLTFAADNGTTGAKKLGDSLSVKGDGNILTRADENGIGFSLADKITVGKAGNGNKPLVIDGTAGLISGLSNTTLGGADFATKGQAASEEQLNAAQANLAKILGGNAANNKGNVTTTDIGGTGKDNVHDAIAAVKETADKGWNLNANDETSSEKIGAGDTVTFKEGKNVKVSRNGKHITVATSDDVSFDKVTVGGSVLTDNGLTVGNGKAGKPVSLTKDGLNNGGNKIANVAKGTDDTDAVNVAQLKAAAAKATSKVDSGNDNIVVTPEQNADGSTTYKVATAPNLKADSFTAGDTVVNNDGVKVGDKVALGKDGLKAGDVNITTDGINAGNKAISNVAEGKKDTDAVNVGQLNRLTAAAKTEVEAGTNIASVSSKQGANGQTVYTVNADGASVSAGSDNIVVTKGNKDANNVTDYAVDLSKAVKADIAKGVAAKDAVDNKGISFAGDSGTTVANKLGDTVAVKGDANITTTAGANGIQVGLNKDLKVDSVKAGDTVVNNNGVNVGDKVALGKDGLKAGDVNITAEGINAGGKKVTGVAAGTVAAGSTDAVNGGQLHQVYELIGSNGGNVNTAPPSVEADGKAGLGNIKNITLVDNSTNPNVTNVTNETKIAQSNGYSLVTYNVEDQGMYVTNNVIEAVGRMNEQGIKFFHTNDGEVNPDVQAYNSEDSSASGAYATAVGFQAASKGTNAIAIGKGAKANAENTIAIGTGNIVSGKNSGAIGDPTVVSGNSSYSIGNNNNVSADNAYALGSNIKATVNDSVYLGDRAQTQGIHTADAAKGEAYTYGGLNDKAVAGKAGSAAAANKVAGVVTVGNGTDETRQVQGVAAGVVSADSTDAINGSQLYYTNQAIANVATQATAAKTEVTAGKNVVVNQTTGNSGQTVYNVATADKLDVTSVTAGGVTVNAQGVSIAAPTAHNPANTVSLSPIGLNNGGQRITNVAPAKEGTDAVNLNQLAGVGNALQNNIERVGKKAYAGVAGAIAQGSIPQVTRPGATGIGVGSGYYGGQSAMAIGVSAMSDGGNWVVKGNFSANTDGHVGVGAGALYQW